MRFCSFTNRVAYTILLFAGTASAEEPRALLDRAIQAHGGAARLERTKKGHLKAKSEGNQSNAPFQVEIEEWFELPDRFRRIIDGSSNGKPYLNEKLVTGKEGWTRNGTSPMQPVSVHESFRVAQHWHAILAVLLLLRDKDVQLQTLPDETKNGRTLSGFRAASPQVVGDFFFDKSTGLLAKGQQITPNPLGGQVVTADASYDDYRDFEGIHYPMRFRTTAGKTYSATITVSLIEFGGKFDESVFKKPPLPVAEAANENDEKTKEPQDRMLIVATVGAGVLVGAVWFIVRAAKRAKRETPPD